jgi:hypothetical protein
MHVYCSYIKSIKWQWLDKTRRAQLAAKMCLWSKVKVSKIRSCNAYIAWRPSHFADSHLMHFSLTIYLKWRHVMKYLSAFIYLFWSVTSMLMTRFSKWNQTEFITVFSSSLTLYSCVWLLFTNAVICWTSFALFSVYLYSSRQTVASYLVCLLLKALRPHRSGPAAK